MKFKRIIALICSIILVVNLFPQNITLTAYAASDKKAITLSDNFESSLLIEKEYDGINRVTVDFSDVELDGVESGDEVQLTGDVEFVDSDAGEHKKAFIFNLSLEGKDASKYQLELTDKQKSIEVVGNITPIVLYLTPKGMLFEGEELPKEIEYDWEESKVIKKDKNNVNVEAKLLIDKVNGEYIYIIDGVTATGNPNYIVDIQSDLRPIVEQPITITLPENFQNHLEIKDKDYDGNIKANIVFSGIKFEGVEAGDDVQLTGDAEYKDPNVGEEKIIVISNLSLEGEDAIKYKLALTAEQERIEVLGNIKPIVLYLTPKGTLFEGEELPKEIEYDWDESVVLPTDKDKVNVTAKLYIVEDNGRFVYLINDVTLTGNPNYILDIDATLRPDVAQPNPPKITDVIVEKDTATNLNQFDFGIVANGSVKLTVEAESEHKIPVVFTLSDGQTYTATDYTENISGKNTTYMYSAEFTETVNDDEGRTISLLCTADNGTQSETPLNMHVENETETTEKLILDCKKPFVSEMKITYDNRRKQFTANGYIMDSESGIQSIRFRWDNQQWETYIVSSNRPQMRIEFQNIVKYKAAQVTETGWHRLFLEITDNAGNIHTENGLYCAASNGPDILPPDVTYIGLNPTDGTPLDTVLSTCSFGNYCRQKLELRVKVKDQSGSDRISGVGSIQLLDGSGHDAKVLAEIQGNTDEEFIYIFLLEPELIIKNWCIRVTDQNDYSRIYSISSLLKSDIATDPDPSVATPVFDWSQITSDKWIFDSASPACQFEYVDEVNKGGTIYFNNKGGTLNLNATDDGGLETVKISQQYKLTSEDTFGDSKTIVDMVFTNASESQCSYSHTVDTSLLPTGWYCFTIEAHDISGNPASKESRIIFVDHTDPTADIEVITPVVTEIDGFLWVSEKDENGNVLPITFRVSTKSGGASVCEIRLDINGHEFIAKEADLSVEEDQTYYDFAITQDQVPFDEQNVYRLEATFRTNSDNYGIEKYTLYVDTQHPTIERFTVEKINTATDTILNVFSFGVFSNDSIRLSVNVQDGENDCGVEDVKIQYAGLSEPVSMKKIDDGIYCYDLDISTQVFQSDISITVHDKIGKQSVSCPNIENIVRDEGVSDNCFVMLENAPAKIVVVLPETDSVQRDDSQIWYRQHSNSDSDQEKMVQVTVHDVDSGIQDVEIRINGQSIALFSSELEASGLPLPTASSTLQMGMEDRDQLCKAYTFQYSMESIADRIQANEDGSYVIEIYVIDNAGNVATVPVNADEHEYADGKVIYFRDEIAPTVTQFAFSTASYDGISEVKQEQFVDKTEYGFYFKRSFDVVITAEDTHPSSQLNTALFRLVSYENGIVQATETYTIPVKEGTARFTVPAGFKGQIFGSVSDKVSNISKECTPQGFVVDETAPTITIEPLSNNYSGMDNHQNKLFMGRVQFKVTISDYQSGLRTIGYAKQSEQDSFAEVVTSIDNFQGYNVDNLIANGWSVTMNDVNLVTSVSQIFTFDYDDNDISMTFTATDRSGNASEPLTSESFTIDTIAPQITISSSEPVNTQYYQSDTQFMIRVVERNFSAERMNVIIKNSFTDASPAVAFQTDPNNPTIHFATVSFPEGDYDFSVSGSDLGGHRAEICVNGGEPIDYFFSVFKVDATAPQIITNFRSFGEDGDPNVYFNKSQVEKTEGNRTEPLLYAIITVIEHNFDVNDMNISVKKKAPGTDHTATWSEDDEMYYFADWQHEGDTHTLQIAFTEDGVYKINIAPVDRANNPAVFAKGSIDHTTVFEVDKTPPQYYARTDEYVFGEGFVITPFYDVYDERRKDEKFPSVEFRDTNFSRIDISAIVYTPVYENGMELDIIKESPLSEKLTVSVTDNVFTLSDFKEDGVYALTFVAVDKAGNQSPVISNTYFRMVNHDVLAYIPGSKKPDDSSKGTGFYSLMYEFEGANGQINYKPISKKATGFSDVDVYVIRPTEQDEIGMLFFQTDESALYPLSDYPGFTKEQMVISETATLVKMHIPKEYYSETFKDDGFNARMDLVVSTQKQSPMWLASIRIDNEKPTASLPDDFRNWHNYFFENEHTIILTDISEILADDEGYTSRTIVYECLRNGERIEIPHTYDAETNTLSFTLGKGVHHIDITLVDEAGNEYNIDRVNYVRVGNLRLYLIGMGILIVAAYIVFRRYLKKKRRHSNIQRH